MIVSGATMLLPSEGIEVTIVMGWVGRREGRERIRDEGEDR
jgi:riboflavin synthase